MAPNGCGSSPNLQISKQFSKCYKSKQLLENLSYRNCIMSLKIKTINTIVSFNQQSWKLVQIIRPIVLMIAWKNTYFKNHSFMVDFYVLTINFWSIPRIAVNTLINLLKTQMNNELNVLTNSEALPISSLLFHHENSYKRPTLPLSKVLVFS